MKWVKIRSRSSRSHIFFKMGVFKNFAVFTGKLLCWSLFLIKLQAFRCLSVNIAKSLRVALFTKHLRWLLLQMFCFNPIQDGLFRGCFFGPLPKICHTDPTMMKLGTVIPYLRKVQKINKSRNTCLEFCWHQHFFTENQQILLHQEIQI